MKKILIANRGEIALRVIRTCKKMGIETVAVYSEVDEELPFVQEADYKFCIGKGPVQQSYLNEDLIIKIAKEQKVDAIHPGYGLLSENSEFAKRVESEGISFIGPKAETISLMGDKIASRKQMQEAGVPVVPGSSSAVLTIDEAVNVAKEIGFPVMLKASGGGGGIGMILCQNEAEIRHHFPTIQARAKTYFRSNHLFVEKFIENGRHIEVQIVGDSYGNIVHLFERDCSVQRRNQKVIEETHSPFLSAGGLKRITEAAVRAAQAVSYQNAGTVEFIVDDKENFYFLEMNTRLQVEHPVTEMVTGIDLVEWQIRIARGERLPRNQAELTHQGHSIEFRLYAEDPETFYPSPGKIEYLKWGNAKNVRIDEGYRAGNQVSPFYDPLLAKCIFYGITRKDCLNQARNFFETTEITGIKTNLPLFLQLLSYEPFIQGNYQTNLLQQMKKNNGGKSQ